jgi:hypothetical protein
MIASRPYRPNHHSSTSTALFGETSGTPDLALLQAPVRVEGKYHRFQLLRESDTDNAMPSEHSNDVDSVQLGGG